MGFGIWFRLRLLGVVRTAAMGISQNRGRGPQPPAGCKGFIVVFLSSNLFMLLLAYTRFSGYFAILLDKTLPNHHWTL
jgi:hypothetical protein